MKLTDKQKKYAPWVIIPIAVILILFVYANSRGPASLWHSTHDTLWTSDHIGENIDTTRIEFPKDTSK